MLGLKVPKFAEMEKMTKEEKDAHVEECLAYNAAKLGVAKLSLKKKK